MIRTAQACMEAALEVAVLAGASAHGYFGRSIAIDRKGDGTPVTEADRRAEAVAREWIEARFPEDGILGEELGAIREQAPRCWLIDPIDGTKSFVRGVPLWGSLVAVLEDGEVLAGAACFPALRETLAAAVGCGCWWNGARCAVSDVADLGRATVLTTDERFDRRPGRREGWLELAQGAGLSRTWGDCAGYLLVATGRAEVMVDPVLAPWDAAPFVPIVEEAGGRLTDWNGNRGLGGEGLIATNAALAREARRRLGCPSAPARDIAQKETRS